MLPRYAATIALVQLIPDLIPGFVAFRHFRLPGQLVHDGIHQCFERFLQIAILLFPVVVSSACTSWRICFSMTGLSQS